MFRSLWRLLDPFSFDQTAATNVYANWVTYLFNMAYLYMHMCCCNIALKVSRYLCYYPLMCVNRRCVYVCTGRMTQRKEFVGICQKIYYKM